METVDCKRGFKFVQTWRDNMSTTDGPRVSPLTQQEQDASTRPLKSSLARMRLAPCSNGS